MTELSEQQKKMLTDAVYAEVVKRLQTKPSRKPRSDIGVKRGPKGKGIAKDGPKRPKTGYVIFLMKERPIVMSLCPHLTPTEAMTEVAKRWKGLDDEEKKYWNDLAIKEKEKEAEAKKTEDKEISDKKEKQETSDKKEKEKKKPKKEDSDSDESSEEEDSDESSEEEESSDESSASESDE